MGSHNRWLVLEAVRTRPGIGRRAIAELVGLTPATVSNIVHGLVRDRIVEQVGHDPSSGGRSTARLSIRRGARFAMGIHIDREQIIAAAVDLGGNVLWSERSAETESDPVQFLTAVAERVESGLAALDLAPERLTGIGLSTPGPLERSRNALANPPNLPGWAGVPVKAILDSKLPTTDGIRLERDANAAAVGEHWAGGASQYHDFAFVYLSTGVGAGLYIGNELSTGHSGGAGALGHIVIDRHGELCECGQQGCLETLCSQSGVLRAAKRHPAAWRRKVGLKLDGHQIDDDYRRLARAADDGDQRATDLFDEAAAALAAGVVSIVNLLDVEAIVLGGRGLWPQQERFLQAITEAVRTRPINPTAHAIEVRASGLGDLAPAVGAAALALGSAPVG
jgi:predicted NBD/HSP70 family sugar kinase